MVHASKSRKPQRILIGMLDGLGLPIYRASRMPTLNRFEAEGDLFKVVSGVFPSVTNVNNVSIACGAWPEEHGITANSWFDPARGEAVYMNDPDLIRSRSIFQRASEWGVRSAMLTSKKKTAELFRSSTEVCIAAEAPDPEHVDRFGPPPPIYSREINSWLWDAAIDLLATRPDLGIVYVHTTDYPMHAWHETDPESLAHLEEMDARIDRAAEVAPDAAILLTADHGMNNKKRCYDLDRICQEAGCPVRFVLSPERDYYVKHHRNFTGCAWIWLNDPEDRGAVRGIVSALEGVEGVMDGKEAARRFHTDPARIGDMVVFGDIHTMFGEMDSAREDLPDTYRAHGSMHEMELPLFIHNFQGALPHPDFFRHNLDLTRFLYRA